MADSAFLDLDGAWHESGPFVETRTDALNWGPKLRYLTSPKNAERFFESIGRTLPPFLIYGSGDFHFLTGLLLRRFSEPLHVISFDNHPDWDRRPPRWACGGWTNRALELPNVKSVSVWGCGNFELKWPSRLTGNMRAVREGRLTVVPWAERQPREVQKIFQCMTRENWRDRFIKYVKRLSGSATYITVDMDCLSAEEAVTNWENGLFTAAEVAWAIGHARENLRIVGGDICGAWSERVYATRFQRLAGWWDHPRLPLCDQAEARRINQASLNTILPAMMSA